MSDAGSSSDRHQALRSLRPRPPPPTVFDVLDGGSCDESTLRRANREDFERVRFRPRVLVNVSTRSFAIVRFGRAQALPLVVAPLGITGFLARRDEVQAVRAAQRCGIPFCLSTASLCPMEEVRAAAADPIWFRLFVGRDRASCAR